MPFSSDIQLMHHLYSAAKIEDKKKDKHKYRYVPNPQMPQLVLLYPGKRVPGDYVLEYKGQ